MTSIGKYAFANCSGLKSVTIGDGVESLYAECFKGCSSLRNVVIGKSVRTIGEAAFEGCDRIDIIYSHPIVPPTCYSENVFDSYVYKAASVYVPNERNAAGRYKADDVWSKFFDIEEMNLTGVEKTPTISPLPAERNYYNLQGQRSVAPARGINIMNGNKVLVR